MAHISVEVSRMGKRCPVESRHAAGENDRTGAHGRRKITPIFHRQGGVAAGRAQFNIICHREHVCGGNSI